MKSILSEAIFFLRIFSNVFLVNYFTKSERSLIITGNRKLCNFRSLSIVSTCVGDAARTVGNAFLFAGGSSLKLRYYYPNWATFMLYTNNKYMWMSLHVWISCRKQIWFLSLVCRKSSAGCFYAAITVYKFHAFQADFFSSTKTETQPLQCAFTTNLR